MQHSQEQAFRPVPQRVDFLVERASCPFLKRLLTMVQHLSKSYIVGRLCFGMSIAPMPATPTAGWETSSRLTATGSHTILDFRF
ncbi:MULTISPECIES: hypothetical protein [unclassified Microcoleus]|uniref:hypothetical protein n=1 Tax=unclassified Microcoleus TaxID=2642155 RepID=UPI002FD3C2DC